MGSEELHTPMNMNKGRARIVAFKKLFVMPRM
jgi:hypothetical protein